MRMLSDSFEELELLEQLNPFLMFYLLMTLLFAQASREEAVNLLRVLHTYILASGQSINLSKSHVLFSRNDPFTLKQDILDLFHMDELAASDKYLGLPMLLIRYRQQALLLVEDKIRVKTQSWKCQLLSHVGRATMVQSVLTVVPTYSMSVFLYPKHFTAKLNDLMSRFWWGGSEDHYKINWV